MGREQGGRSRSTDEEQIAQRVRAQARSLSGRIFARAGKVLLVEGEPEVEALLRGLNGRTGPPESSGTPGPRDLGFPVSAIREVTRPGLSAGARSLQKWRKVLQEESARGRLGTERRAVLDGWTVEVERLSRRVPVLHALLAEAGRPGAGSPFRLEAEVEEGLATEWAKTAAGRVVPPALDWLVRLSAWVSGLPAARRLLVTACGPLCDPPDQAARAALMRVRALSARLAAYLARPDVERETRRDWRQLPQFDHVRRAVADLPEGLAGAARVTVKARNRDLDLTLLVRRCDEALARFPKEPAWHELSRVAALYLTDGGATSLPWAAVAGGADDRPSDAPGEPGRRLIELAAQGRQPGYETLLSAIGSDPKLIEEPERARHLLLAGATVPDVSWCFADHHGSDLAAGDGRNLRPVHALVEWFEARGEAVDWEDVHDLLKTTAGPAARAGLECLNRHLAWLPAGPGSPQVVSAVREVVRMLSTFRELPGPMRDRLRQWADPPRGACLPEGCPDDLPGGLPALVRRLAFYRRMAGQPDRLPKSLRKPLEAAGRAAREARHLRALEAAGTLGDGPRARLRHLEERAEAGSAGPAPGKLVRLAREACSLAAMDAIRAAFRREAERFWSERFGLAKGLDTFRSDDLWELTHWIEDLPQTERDLVEPILAAFRAQGALYRAQLPGNRAWLDRAEAQGVVLDAWLNPAPSRSKLADGAMVTLAPAIDPRDVFLMGTRFHTCLGLRRGGNRWSVIANAAHANKAVVDARDEAGRPLARKLVAVTAELKLVGFNTYLVEGADPDALRAAIEAYCGAWAARAGLALTDSGRPEDLGGRGWYDDGSAAWSSSARAAWHEARLNGPPLAEPGPDSAADHEPEAAWCAAVRSGDPRALEAHLGSPDAEADSFLMPAAFWSIVHSLDRPGPISARLNAVAQQPEFRRVRRHLAARGLTRGLASPNELVSSEWGNENGLEFLTGEFLSLLPLDRGRIVEAIDHVCRTSFRNWASVDDYGYSPPGPLPGLALAPLSDVVRWLRAVDRLVNARSEHGNGNWDKDWLLALRLAWFRDRDPVPVVRAVRDGSPAVRRVVLKLCEEVFIPEAITELRRLLKRLGVVDEAEPIARVLATWACPQDAARAAAWGRRWQSGPPPERPEASVSPEWIAAGLGALRNELASAPDRIAQLADDARAAETLAWWRELYGTLSAHNLLGAARETVGRLDAAVGRIPLDPHRPLALRLAAVESSTLLKDGSWFVRMGLANEWAVAFESDRAALPASVREDLVRACLAGLRDGWDSVASTLLAWLETFGPDDRVRLCREDSTGIEALARLGEDRPAFAIFIQALGSPHAEAACALLAACAPAHPDLFLRYLDAAFHWLHPDRIEPLAADLIRHLPAGDASEGPIRAVHAWIARMSIEIS